MEGANVSHSYTAASHCYFICATNPWTQLHIILSRVVDKGGLRPNKNHRQSSHMCRKFGQCPEFRWSLLTTVDWGWLWGREGKWASQELPLFTFLPLEMLLGARLHLLWQRFSRHSLILSAWGWFSPHPSQLHYWIQSKDSPSFKVFIELQAPCQSCSTVLPVDPAIQEDRLSSPWMTEFKLYGSVKVIQFRVKIERSLFNLAQPRLIK